MDVQSDTGVGSLVVSGYPPQVPLSIGTIGVFIRIDNTSSTIEIFT